MGQPKHISSTQTSLQTLRGPEINEERGWVGEVLVTGLSISVSLCSTPWSPTKLRRAPLGSGISAWSHAAHMTQARTLSFPPSDTHYSWGKYITHLIASFSTQGIILERICPYFADSWGMNHRGKEIIGQDKERTSKQDRDPVLLRLATVG